MSVVVCEGFSQKSSAPSRHTHTVLTADLDKSKQESFLCVKSFAELKWKSSSPSPHKSHKAMTKVPGFDTIKGLFPNSRD